MTKIKLAPHLKLTVKAAAPWSGKTTAVLGRMGVVDRDGDIMDKGFVANAGDPVEVSPWGHSLIKDPGSERAGVGVVKEEGEEFVIEVTWDDTPTGRAACAKVAKERPDWSWGFPEPETRTLTAEEKARGAKRAIKSVAILEASPVDAGAGIAQGTLEVCCGACKEGKACDLKTLACKCAGECSCGGKKKEDEDDDEELVEAPGSDVLDRIRLAQLGAVKETDNDRDRRLAVALQEAFGSAEESIEIADVLSDEGAVVYWRRPNDGNGPWPPVAPHHRVDFTADEGGGFTFGEPAEVQRATQYVAAGAD